MAWGKPPAKVAVVKKLVNGPKPPPVGFGSASALFLALALIGMTLCLSAAEAQLTLPATGSRLHYRGKEIFLSGANCARIWVHTDGSDSPQFDGQGKVTGLSGHFLDDMQAVLDSAQTRGILVLFSIWSERMKNGHHELVTDTVRTRSYIDKALIPMVKRFKTHPALVAWEVLNEPEGMTQAWGWKDANLNLYTNARLLAAGLSKRLTKAAMPGP
jgi:Cellulase (glycosyl hydrolase family 5)